MDSKVLGLNDLEVPLSELGETWADRTSVLETCKV